MFPYLSIYCRPPFADWDFPLVNVGDKYDIDSFLFEDPIETFMSDDYPVVCEAFRGAKCAGTWSFTFFFNGKAREKLYERNYHVKTRLEKVSLQFFGH
jgi:hypothetical protein